MKTPICDFVQEYTQKNVTRFHMPGHKGCSSLGCEALDITEIGGADVLYSPDGIIAESEGYATELFGTAHSFYSTEGSSLAIRAMLALVKSESEDEKPLILAARNVHKVFLYACALLDLDIEWLYPSEFSHVCECKITPQALEERLGSSEKKPSAVYITSPDYLGSIADISALARVCDAHKIPLLVDNAHGAYLKFLPESRHPIALGATLCCDSAHKTLPVLTGGAYLHVSKKAPAAYLENARNALSLFASTSPSYLILQSLDLCNAYLSDGYREKLADFAEKLESIKARIASLGYELLGDEPLKLVIDARARGYSGNELADALKKSCIECEFSDPELAVLMVTPKNSEFELFKLTLTLQKLEKKDPIEKVAHPCVKPTAVLSPREAIFAKCEQIATVDAVGRICASPTVACPPAVPIVMSGERIEREHADLMKYYGYKTVFAVK